MKVVCPHCLATNRVPETRPAAAARCGSCHEVLFDGHPAGVDAAGLDKHRSANEVPVLVDVWAPWCGPCRAMAPQFERAAAELEPQVRLLKLNSDENPQAASQLNISGIPALLLFRNGELVARSAGAMDARNIVAWVRQHLH